MLVYSPWASRSRARGPSCRTRWSWGTARGQPGRWTWSPWKTSRISSPSPACRGPACSLRYLGIDVAKLLNTFYQEPIIYTGTGIRSASMLPNGQYGCHRFFLNQEILTQVTKRPQLGWQTHHSHSDNQIDLPGPPNLFIQASQTHSSRLPNPHT